MNPMFKRAVGMLGQRASGKMMPPSGGPGPMVNPKAPSGMGGGMMDRLRNRVRGKSAGTPGGPTAMKRPPAGI